MRAKIQNINDLRSEISRLKMQRLVIEDDIIVISDKIKTKFRVPLMIYNKVQDFFSRCSRFMDTGTIAQTGSDPRSRALRSQAIA